MKTNEKLIIFDLDGTLIDSDLMIVISWLKMFAKYKKGYIPSLKEMIYFSGPPIRESLKKALPEIDVETSLNSYREYSSLLYDDYVQLFPCVKKTLAYLKSQNIKIALFTNKNSKQTLWCLKKYEIAPYFDFVIDGGCVKRQKPNPEGINLILKKFNFIKKKNVYYVGDSIFDYQASLNAKVKFIFANYGLRKLPQELKIKYSINSLKDIYKVIKND